MIKSSTLSVSSKVLFVMIYLKKVFGLYQVSKFVKHNLKGTKTQDILHCASQFQLKLNQNVKNVTNE